MTIKKIYNGMYRATATIKGVRYWTEAYTMHGAIHNLLVLAQY